MPDIFMQKTITHNPFVLTADIGGSHVTAAICNLETGSVIKDTRFRTEFSSKSSAESILENWIKVFNRALGSFAGPVSKMGIAMPGPFDYEQGISYITGLNKYENLYGINIKEHLAANLNLDPRDIKFRNDAEAAIAGEIFASDIKNYESIVGITLGTGFGSAHYKNGITTDLNWGSDAYKTSIADDHLSTRWFIKRYYELTGVSVQGVKELALIAAESSMARIVFSEFGKNLYEFLAAKFMLIEPQALIISGNIAQAHRYFIPYLSKQILPVQTEMAKQGEDAALLGAAALFQIAEEFIQ